MRRDIFSGTFFLVISILATAEASVSVMNSAPDVLGILFSVALWLMYASAKNGGEIRGARMFSSTTLKASYHWVTRLRFNICPTC